jgi:sulfur carrier protein ThiS
MNITLKLFASLRRHLPEGTQGSACELEVAAGTSAGEVLARYDVPTDGIIILVNGHTVGLDCVLEEDDVVAAFLAVAGG